MTLRQFASMLLVAAPAFAGSPVAITSPAPPAATVDLAYSITFAASGGVTPYKWGVISGALPAGLYLNTASGVLAGMAEAAGAYQFAVLVEDSGGHAESTHVTFQVLPAPLTVTTKSLPAGIVGLDYPPQILGSAGGTGDRTFALAAGSALPPGMTLTDDVIAGIPTTAGSFPISVVVTDSSGATAAASLTLTIRPSTVDLSVGAASISFTLAANAAVPPPTRHISVQSSAVAQPLTYTAAASVPTPWLTISSGGTTPDALSVALNNQSLSLPPGDYPASVALTCTALQCNGKTQTIAIDLTVTAPPPRLKIETSILSFSSTPDLPVPPGQPLIIENIGSGSLGISSVACAAAWCTVGSVPGSVGAGTPAMIPVTVNPVGMSPGYYRTTITVVSSNNTSTAPVTLLISPGAFKLAPTGAQFRMIAGAAPGDPKGSFRLSVSGVSPIAWTATILPGAPWLQLVAGSGTVLPSTPATVSYTIDTSVVAALAAQTWYGTIRISAKGVVDSPRDYQVVLVIAPPGSLPKPLPEPAGLVFTTNAGASPPPQSIQVQSGSKAPAQYSVSVATQSGGPWLSVNPLSGSSSSSIPDSTSVSVNASGLATGVYRGGVTYAFASAAIRTVNVTLVVRPPGSGSVDRGDARAVSACTPSALAATQTALVDNFSIPTAWPTPIEIALSDNCGNLVVNGQIVATFSNGDAPLSMPLADSATATYSATWTPQRAGSGVTITANVTAPGFPAASVSVAGAVMRNEAPALNPNAVLHVFNPQIGAPLAPGTIVQIYGSNLASQTGQPTSIPLPQSLGSVSVIVGGLLAPLYYVSPGQINAQIPFELDPNGQYEVVISANGALTTPQSIQLAPVTPGLCIYGDGAVIGQHQDGSLINRQSPAMPGEYAVMYLAGMGLTDTPVSSGAASPSNPPAHPMNAPTLSIAGNPVPVAFAGLTPTLVGLYQINFQIPANLSGSMKLEISQNGTVSNSTLLPLP